jgi:polyphosphate kinase 2 (PPK2 family)
LDTLDMSLSVPRDTYTKRLALHQGRINRHARRLAAKKRGVIVVFEGSDAAGKGGAIRRLTHALDARQYRVIPIAAPTDEERAHHYLWRFWRHIPRLGRFTIYDRSWYGRVLVERVEGFAAEHEWQRAYKEINDFEYQLVDSGILVVKFWLHITPDEQLRRFEEREHSPYKQFKITEEDYRNRAKANDYELAASEMIERTSTEYCPWTIVEANDKRYARIKVLSTIHRCLKNGL